MKYSLTLIFCSLFALGLLAQPANDECSTAIELGTAPNCDPGTFYTNVAATASNIGSLNSPTCFNGGTTQRDVWFSFVASDTIVDYLISITGGTDGMGSTSILNPQVTLYRGECGLDGLAELLCASADPGETEVQIPVMGLTPGITYFLRVNDYSATGSPNAGTFNVCVEQAPPFNTIDQGGSVACEGTLFDSGGEEGNYGNNEDFTFQICPNTPNACITLDFQYYNIEYYDPDFGTQTDEITIYDGPDINSPVIATLNNGDADFASSGGVCFRATAISGCMTVRFESDAQVNFEGFEATWQCSTTPCETLAVLEVDTEVTELQLANALAGPATVVSNLTIDCEDGSYGVFNGMGTDLGLNQGILLTSGLATNAIGPNNLTGLGTDVGGFDMDGDADLDSLSAAEVGIPFPESNDACVVELDVFANTDELVFEYIFGSEEYPEYVGGVFNDIFAFLISGPGIVGDPVINNQLNIAVLPDAAQTPVQINSVNAGSNNEYYRDNESGQAGESVQYDGLTSDFQGVKKSLTARADVTPCQTYHLKLAIADRQDGIFDSGVFISDLRGGAPELAINFQNGIDYFVEDCTDEGSDILEIRLLEPAEVEATYNITITGTATQGEDYVVDLPSSVTFGVGEDLFTFPISILSDLLEEGTETIIISLSIDFGCGETTISTLEVELRDQLQVNINGLADTAFYCIGSGATLNAVGAQNFFWQPADIFSDPLASPTFATPTESQLVTVIGTLGPCSDTASIFLQLIDPMVNILNGDSLAICRDDEVFLFQENNLNEDATITWSPAFNIVGSPMADSVAIDPFGDGLFFVTAEQEGCTSTDSIFVDADFLNIPEVIADTILCESYPIQLAVQFGFDDGNTNYQWTPDIFLDDATDPETIARPEQNTTYQLISSTANGACADTQSVMVSIIPSRINITGGDTLELCLGQTTILNAVALPAGGSPINWSPSVFVTDGVTTGPTLSLDPQSTILYTATYTVNNCFQSDQILVKVDSLPQDLSFTFDPEKDPYCQGEEVTITSPIYDVGDFPDIDHSWLSALGQQTPDSLYNMIFNAQDTSEYIRVTTSGACFDTIRRTINVLTPPEYTLTPQDTSICAGESFQYDFMWADSTTEGSITWEPGDGLSCTDCFDPVASPTTSTTYMITLEVEGSDCSFPIQRTVAVRQQPMPVIADNSVVCFGESVVLLLTDREPGVTYSVTGGGINSTDPKVVLTPQTTTTYTFTATNSCGVVTRDVLVTVAGPIDLSINGPTELCSGDPVSLSAQTNAAAGVMEQFTWTVNGIITGFNQTVELMSVPGVYNVQLTYSYNDCETLTRSTTVTVFESPSLQLPQVTTICLGESLTLNLAPTAATTYQWTGTDGFTSTDAAPTVTPTTTTTYTVVATTPNCDAIETTFVLNVIGEYTVTAPADFSVCQNEGFTLSATVDPAGTPGTFTWSYDFVTSDGPDLEISEADANFTRTYQVTFVDDAGCFSSSDEVTIEVFDPIEAGIRAFTATGNALGLGDTIFAGDMVSFTGFGLPEEGFDYTFEWSGNGDPTTGVGETIDVTAPITGVTQLTYNLDVTSEPGGCPAAASFFLVVEPVESAVPEVFTPNGDGRNDAFRIFYNGNVRDFTLIVYNRWGQKVFETNDPLEVWTGERDGTAQPADVYLYRAMFNQNGQMVEKTGEVTLLR
ncbi:MAG: choice-of-anchor L domain-containing protein [Saprospiraceae bacterium]